ncbi:hydroxymethylbilane synthase [Microbacteriaceae bacterium MWH-Ta3]|nr:hydroxymethylbilane synthase [Microbacteriaceae bacterium MWH-Ta3]
MVELCVGTRASLLALTQTRLFTAALMSRNPEIRIEEVHIVSEGDRSTAPLSAHTTPGIFVSALRDELIAGRVDFIVHSMKDLPAAPHPDIMLACVPTREDARDVLVSRGGQSLDALAPGSRVGTSSPRRAAGIRRLRPDLELAPIRGNIDTRIRKVHDGEYDATILALAGLRRVGLEDAISETLDVDAFLPAPRQGALAIECRASDTAVSRLLQVLDDSQARVTAVAEQALLIGVGAGCSTAIGGHARIVGQDIVLCAELAVEHTGEYVRIERATALSDEPEKAAFLLGLDVADSLNQSPLRERASFL